MEILHFLVGIAVLVAVAMLLLHAAGVKLGMLPATAIARAIIQLAAITVLLSGVARWPLLVLAFIALMLTTASLTSMQRAAELPRGREGALVGVLIAGVMTTGLVLLLQLVPLTTHQIIAVAGIVIGNSMSAVTLTSRRMVSTFRTRAPEIEGWLALGGTYAQATAELRRESIKESLLPNMDQTRNTGLVTLPGAFVGALFGGASPLQAGMFQVTVLAAIMVATILAGVVVSWFAGRATQLPHIEHA